MKKYLRYTFRFLIPVILLVAVVTACEDDDESGTPKIHYIRATDPTKSDSLLTGAFLGDLVAIVGENLGSARNLWFNDKEAQLIPTYITDNVIMVNVPSAAPAEVSDLLQIKFSNGEMLRHDFVIEISAPALNSMYNEYAAEGSTTLISGDYFFEPLTVLFGNVEGAAKVINQNTIEVTIPAGAPSGPVTIKTNFGSGVSSFHYRDQRNVFLNYDDLNADGSWRSGIYINDENSLDGNYLRLRGKYSADNPTNEGPDGDDVYESQFWAKANGRPEGSLIPGKAEDYVMKFEANVVEWYGSHLNICFGPYANNGNQEIWSNDFNLRGVWAPWQSAGTSYSTDGKWMTVTLPITDFYFKMERNNNNDVVYNPGEFSKFSTAADKAGSLSFWMLGAPVANNSPFEVYIDNVRIVSK